MLVGVGAYTSERDVEPKRNRISVRVKLSPKGLPTLDVSVFRDGRWVTSGIQDVEPTDQALYWPGVLPAFAVSELTVSTQEERSRLVQLTRVTSNLDLRHVPVRVSAARDEIFEPSVPPPELTSNLDVPDIEDAIHGALSMAVWGVPRMARWLDLLIASLGSDQARLSAKAREVEAPWWRFPPWRRPLEVRRLSCLQECLWLAAIKVFRGESRQDIGGGLGLPEQIAADASHHGDKEVEGSIRAWRESTQKVLRGQAEISIERWRSNPVGIALQLVLTRPRPVVFKGWFKQLPDLPPPIAWSAAALCGLLYGYRRLDTEFRGGDVQQQVLSIHALHLSYGDGTTTVWPTITDAVPRWRKDDGEFVLSWGDRDFARKREKARERWIAADFKDERVLREATRAARQLSWPCFNREIELIDQFLPLRGLGSVEVVPSQSRIEVRGPIRLTVPDDIPVEERLNVGKFRRLVAVERGPLPEPPPAAGRETREATLEVPGLVYRPDFLSRGEEEQLVAMIDGSHWESKKLRRRVQHYGWRYSYSARRVDTSMRLGQLPPWAGALAERLVDEGLLHESPDQVIVNEYLENQGISRHIDHEGHFADGIAMISLLEPWEMIFRGPGGTPKVGQVLQPGSVAAMHGDARSRWTHEIPRRKNEPGWGPRHRRISLTFRKVLLP